MTVLKDAFRFFLKTGDTQPSIRRKLISKTDGTPIDLTLATVKFLMMDSDGNVKVNAAAVIEDALGGVVRYDWVAADTTTAGTFDAEFQISFPSGGIFTMPSDGYIVVEITEELGS